MPSRKTFNIQEILDLEADLASRSLDEVIRFFRKRYDLANITYVCASFPERSILNPVVSTTYSDAWVEHYKREGYWFIDPVINTGARSLLPFDWAWLSRDSKKVRRMFGEAQEAGIGRHGLTIPVRGPLHRVWALFNLTSDESDEAWRLCPLGSMRPSAEQRLRLVGSGQGPIVGWNAHRQAREKWAWCIKKSTKKGIGIWLGVAIG